MPRMPLSGVRISCDTIARKRDLARLAASAWSRALGERVLGLDTVGDVVADALHLGLASSRTEASRHAIQRAPSGVAIFWSWVREPSGSRAGSPCSSTGSA